MTYAEKRRLVVKSRVYRRLVKVLGILLILFAVAMEGLMARLFLTGGGLSPGDRNFFVFSLVYWAAVAALLYGLVVAFLRFVAPALMSDARVPKLAEA